MNELKKYVVVIKLHNYQDSYTIEAHELIINEGSYRFWFVDELGNRKLKLAAPIMHSIVVEITEDHKPSA